MRRLVHVIANFAVDSQNSGLTYELSHVSSRDDDASNPIRTEGVTVLSTLTTQ